MKEQNISFTETLSTARMIEVVDCLLIDIQGADHNMRDIWDTLDNKYPKENIYAKKYKVKLVIKEVIK